MLPEPGGLPACWPKVAHFAAFDHQAPSAEPLLSGLAYRLHWLLSAPPLADAWYEFAGGTPRHATWPDRLGAALGLVESPEPSVP